MNKVSHAASELFKRLSAGDRSTLARCITLVESSHSYKRAVASEILSQINKLRIPKSQSLSIFSNKGSENRGINSSENFKSLIRECGSFRIGLTGPPGSGKSTFLDQFGMKLINEGHKIAILAVDPSSKSRGGSLLGDKTRMSELSKTKKAFIRPSPSLGALGGVSRSTREAIILCELAGFDVIFVETVGVGQSETTVYDMVDMFCLLLPPAGGDELQGMKKGIVELADLIIVNKADGDLLPAARRLQSEYMSALKLIHSLSSSSSSSAVTWRPKVTPVSSKTKIGLDDVWLLMMDFLQTSLECGSLSERRFNQRKTAMWHYIENEMNELFRTNKLVDKNRQSIEMKVSNGSIDPHEGAVRLIELFLQSIETEGLNVKKSNL